jgi:hypothetical protein
MALAARDMLDSAGTGATAQKKRIRYRFSCWTFQLIFSADVTALTRNGGRASSSVTLQERQKTLLGNIRSRVDDTITKPDIVTLVEAYFDSSRISGVLPEDISICIALLGFDQTRTGTSCEVTTM